MVLIEKLGFAVLSNTQLWSVCVLIFMLAMVDNCKHFIFEINILSNYSFDLGVEIKECQAF